MEIAQERTSIYHEQIQQFQGKIINGNTTRNREIQIRIGMGHGSPENKRKQWHRNRGKLVT